MLGFIKKDLAMIKSNFKSLIFLVIIYLLLGLYGQMDISFILPFISVMLIMSTFNYDNYNKWDAYAATLPNGRINSVRAKYLITIIIIVITTIFVILLEILFDYLMFSAFNYMMIIITTLTTCFATLLLESIMYPFIYKFGIEKARIAIFLLIFGISFLFGALSSFINLGKLINNLSFLGNWWFLITLIVILFVLYLSYKISLRIYKRKEF